MLSEIQLKADHLGTVCCTAAQLNNSQFFKG